MPLCVPRCKASNPLRDFHNSQEKVFLELNTLSSNQTGLITHPIVPQNNKELEKVEEIAMGFQKREDFMEEVAFHLHLN